MTKSITCMGWEIKTVLKSITDNCGIIESVDAMVDGKPAQWRVNYFERVAERKLHGSHNGPQASSGHSVEEQ